MHKRMTSSNKEWSSIQGVWTINSMLKVVSWCWLLTSSARRRRVCVQPGGFPKSKREGAPTDSRLLAFRSLDGNSRAAARNHTEFLEVFTRDGVYFGSIREDDVETAVGLKVTFCVSVSWLWACACSFRNTACDILRKENKGSELFHNKRQTRVTNWVKTVHDTCTANACFSQMILEHLLLLKRPWNFLPFW